MLQVSTVHFQHFQTLISNLALASWPSPQSSCPLPLRSFNANLLPSHASSLAWSPLPSPSLPSCQVLKSQNAWMVLYRDGDGEGAIPNDWTKVAAKADGLISAGEVDCKVICVEFQRHH